MEPKSSLRHLQVPAICPYPTPFQSNPYLSIRLLEDQFLYYLNIYAYVWSPSLSCPP